MTKKIINIFDELFTGELSSEFLKKSNTKSFEMRSLTKEYEVEDYIPPKYQLRNLFGKKGRPFSESIGTHPDFIGKEEIWEKQYICSLFLDISGSTKLGLKLSLEDVRLIKNAVLTSAIEIFQVFDGHIHRLQGDAVFAYFGHKNMTKSEAIVNALNAASLMQSYNKNTLNEFFDNNNLPLLKIRIGIDIGDDNQVFWSSFGIDGVQEITTTSIHTDLAAKLQSKASVNSILIGENIYNYLDLPEEFLRIKKITVDKKLKDDKYIIQDSESKTSYQMKVFEWEKYLNSFAFLPKEEKEKYTSPKDFEIICSYNNDEMAEMKEYKSNTDVLPKNQYLKFQLILKGVLQVVKPEKITWQILNRGKEALEANSLSADMDSFKNNYICNQSTAYNGHHYMICKIYDSQSNIIGQDRFGLFINDEKIEMKKLGVEDE